MESGALPRPPPPRPPPPPAAAARMHHQRSTAPSDSVMMKHILATHNPDGRTVNASPILSIVEGILRHAALSIGSVPNGKHEHPDALMEEKVAHASYDGTLEALASTIHRISCELSCKCTSGGGRDGHGTTMAIFKMLSPYSWDVKVVLALAAFAVNYGEFSIIANLYATSLMAKFVAALKQLPDILEHSSSLKPQFDALNNLTAAMLNVTKCILMFRDLPSQYISAETPPLSTAMTHIPTAAYWTIRSIVACASQIASLIGLGHDYMPLATEAWELSSLAYKVSNIHDHLKTQLSHCHQHIDEKRYSEVRYNLVQLFKTYHVDNMKILKALIYANPLLHGFSKTQVGLDVLRKRTVLLLISDLDIPQEDILVLGMTYQESRESHDLQYEIVWIPIVEGDPRSPGWDEANLEKFHTVQSSMPWYSVHHPSVIELYVAKYIREVWHFTSRPILVALDAQGKVASPNAFHMLWIWGNLAFPFTKEKAEELWKVEVWRLELIIDGLDPRTLDWISAGKYICLYGGDDIDWIRKFTTMAKDVAKAAGIELELLYVGKNNAEDRVRKTAQTVIEEKLSYCLDEPVLFWYFWTRLESMFFSKLQHGKSTANDQIMQEVMTILSYDCSEKGWAMFCRGIDIAKAKAETALETLSSYNEWKDDSVEIGPVAAMKKYLQKIHTPHHCSRLILPGLAAGIPEQVICAECGRIMEKFIMYRCCIE